MCPALAHGTRLPAGRTSRPLLPPCLFLAAVAKAAAASISCAESCADDCGSTHVWPAGSDLSHAPASSDQATQDQVRAEQQRGREENDAEGLFADPGAQPLTERHPEQRWREHGE